MASKQHAILSASSSDRWIHCPPSARLCETYEDKGSDYAAEGTDAHALGEYKLKTALGLSTEDPTESLKWYSEEMEDCASGYSEYVLEQVEAAKKTCADPVVLIEQRVDFSRWVEQGFGTADCIIIADGTLRVIDYKHGLGVLVSAEANPQMQCYALGALELFDDIYNIDTVSMTIYQPRRQNVSTYEISKEDLYRWADEVLKPTAELAFAGDGNFLCGEWCGFCKAKNECRARAEANLKLAQHDFKLPPLLTDTEIEVILGKVDELVSWAYDIKEYALQQALSGKNGLASNSSKAELTVNTAMRLQLSMQSRKQALIRMRKSCWASPPCRNFSASPALMNSCRLTSKSHRANPHLCRSQISARP